MSRIRSLVASIVALLSLALVVTTTGARSAAAQEKPRSGGSMTWLISAEYPSFDPIAITNGLTSPSLYSIYDRLVYLDPTSGQIVPALALSVTSTDDAKTWTIKLRPNVKFTDGTNLDAAAVKFNWDRIRDTPTALDSTVLKGFASYDVVDPTTVRVVLSQATGSFPALLQGSLGAIASPAAIAKYGSAYGTSASSTVGAGPFKMSEWVRDDHITLVRDETYWDKPRPYLDTLTLKPVADTTQKANAFIAGQADMVYLPVISSADQVLLQARAKYASVLQDGGISVVYNTSKAPLDDARVRRALTLALDLNDLNAKAANGLATPADTFAPKSSPFYDASVKQKTNNLAEAQKLVDAYVGEHGGTPITFDLLAPSSLKAWADPTLQQWARLKNVNIVSDIESPTAAQAKGNTGNFQAWYAATSIAGSTRYTESFYKLFRTGQTTNVVKYSNPSLDKVLDSNRDAVSLAQRRDAVSKITKILMDDSVFSMIYRLEQRTYYGSKVRGVKMVQDQFPGTASLWLSSK